MRMWVRTSRNTGVSFHLWPFPLLWLLLLWPLLVLYGLWWLLGYLPPAWRILAFVAVLAGLAILGNTK